MLKSKDRSESIKPYSQTAFPTDTGLSGLLKMVSNLLMNCCCLLQSLLHYVVRANLSPVSSAQELLPVLSKVQGSWEGPAQEPRLHTAPGASPGPRQLPGRLGRHRDARATTPASSFAMWVGLYEIFV